MLSALGYVGASRAPFAASDRDPKDHVWELAHFERARDLADRKLFAEAMRELAPVLERDPTNPEAAFLAGQAAWSAGDLETAEARLGRSLALKPDRRAAAARFRETLRGAPTFSRAKLNLAVLLLNQARKTEAEALLREYVRERPNAFDGWELLGSLLGDDPASRPEAIEALERALAIRPGAAEVAERLRRLRSRPG
jgi:tetratricopeptide (TPR) repeat protein